MFCCYLDEGRELGLLCHYASRHRDLGLFEVKHVALVLYQVLRHFAVIWVKAEILFFYAVTEGRH